MPTYSFIGKQYLYAQSVNNFDVQKTPSRTGLLSEIFRRMPDVTRSLHPTHSVAAWGMHAKEIISQHHFGTAFGTNSPFYRLGDFDGLVIGLGVGFQDAFSILHVPEEMHPRTHKLVFSNETVVFQINNGTETFKYDLIPMRLESVRRNDRLVEKILRREGFLRHVRKQGLLLQSADAEPLIRIVLELIDSNLYLPSRREKSYNTLVDVLQKSSVDNDMECHGKGL